MNVDQTSHKNLVIQCSNLCKSYQQGPQKIEVLQGINLEVARAEKLAIVGASGSGKTTLLNMLGGLDAPSQGTVAVNGQVLSELKEQKKGLLRNQCLGFVYQFHHLLGEFSAQENVMIPLLIRGQSRSEAASRAVATLAKVGLESRLVHKPSELSGGERQRVAIARALVTEPDCVLMDEPTGNLDNETAIAIHQLMVELNDSLEISFIIVTHDISLARRMDRILKLKSGILSEI